MSELDEPRLAAANIGRREFLKGAAMLGAAAGAFVHPLAAMAGKTITLPFERGRRPLGPFAGKHEMIILRERAPLLETPFPVYDKGVFTPNDEFFVRWHLSGIPTSIDAGAFRLRIHGHVKTALELTLDALLKFKPTRFAAVNQCSGNSRGFFNPRVPGGEWGNGAMGNAMWTGVPLKILLDRAGLRPGALAVRYHGLDHGEIPDTPRFMKSLALEHAMDGEVMVAYEMNGSQLPLLNGFPLRMVVPGWYGTYWVKMLSDIEVLDHPDEGFWMTKSYLIPDTPDATMKPGEKGVKMVPINRMVPRSFITSPAPGELLHEKQPAEVRGIAFGGDTGVKRVELSLDGGTNWRPTTLGRDYGKYGMRRWHSEFTPSHKGEYLLMARATNSDGLAQPLTPNWNPSGFMRNVVERVRVDAG